MADARYPERWLSDRRVQRLTDRAYRSFMQALAWSVSNRTDGYLEPEDLPLVPSFSPGADDELVAAGLWLQQGRGWLIEPFAETQATRTELEAVAKARASNRERQARWRLNHAETPNVTYNVSPAVTETVKKRVTTQDRTGQASPVLKEGDIPTEVTTLPSPKLSLRKSGTSLSEARKRATRLPQGWEPPRDVITAMHERFPHVDLRVQHELFGNYWHAKGGQNATKLDWVATWRNWIIKAAEETPQRNGHAPDGPDAKALKWLELGNQPDQPKGLPQK